MEATGHITLVGVSKHQKPLRTEAEIFGVGSANCWQLLPQMKLHAAKELAARGVHLEQVGIGARADTIIGRRHRQKMVAGDGEVLDVTGIGLNQIIAVVNASVIECLREVMVVRQVELPGSLLMCAPPVERHPRAVSASLSRCTYQRQIDLAVHGEDGDALDALTRCRDLLLG